MLKQILVVDDNLEIRTLYRMLLESHHLDILEASDGIEALEILANTEVDLIITDCTMPRRSGPEMIATIKSLYPSLPFIVVSSTERKMDFEELNPVAMLSKPFYLKELVNVVDETVGT
jgi:two-component system cell cycle sensor histidine kinase/response regulator CckA